ncbi:GvpL/GvpF family gas vesicle protein [Streptomyces sp. NPDC051322]|uniref:GvpL/GvpF family gas vesicle protein n=1 Tax=Streptomyces sp. NPDC051322 TaxID=3154645 RepID=UPI00344F9F06
MTVSPATYVFAVCGPDHPRALGSAGGHPEGGPLRFLPIGSLRAVVQDVPAAAFAEAALRERLADAAELERCARTHHDVVSAAAAGGPAVPLPLATLYRGDERAAAALAENQERFRAVLDRIAGRAEWAVKVYLTQPARPAPPTRPDRPLTHPDRPPAQAPPETSGRAYLNRLRGRQQLRERQRENALAAAERVDSAVRQIAAGSVRRRPHGPEVTGHDRTQIMNAAYLIARDRSDEPAATIGRLRGAPGFDDVEIDVSGPWAPYSFTDGDERAGHH